MASSGVRFRCGGFSSAKNSVTGTPKARLRWSRETIVGARCPASIPLISDREVFAFRASASWLNCWSSRRRRRASPTLRVMSGMSFPALASPCGPFEGPSLRLVVSLRRDR